MTASDLRPATGSFVSAREPEFGLDLVRAFQMVRRRLRLAIGIAAILTLVAAAVIMQLPKRYTAEALLVLNARASKLAELQSPTESLLSRTQADQSIIRTETEILTSEVLLRAVAERLDLVNDPVFQGRKEPGAWAGWLQPIQDFVASLRGGSGGAASDDEPATGDPLAKTVEQLGRAVSVVNEGGSYAIRIRAETGDPELSARIANSLAEAYLANQREQQAQTLKAASDWLSQRLRELRSAAVSADDAAERFRARNQLAQSGAPTLLDTEIAEVTTALIEASKRLSRAQASLNEVRAATRRGGDLASSGIVLASPTIQTLRQQESEILIRRGALARDLGQRHPQVAAVEAELEAVRAKITLEVDRIVASLRSEVNAIQDEIRSLESQRNRLQARLTTQAEAQVQLAEFEREAQAAREVYTQFLQHFNATLAQQTDQQPDARLVAPARPPLEPSAPRRKLLLIGAVVGASAMGVLVALLVGLLRGGFGGPVPLEQATRLPTLELLPEVKQRRLAHLFDGGLAEEANPVRSLAYALSSRLNPSSEGAVILITSSVAGEGKSLLGITLARTFALQGRRTLLIDLDAWQPSLHRLARHLPLKPASGGTIAGSPVVTDTASGLQLIALDRPLAPAARPAFVAAMVELLPELRRSHDVVILDAPPVLAVPDVLLAAAHADGTLLVVRFEGPDAATVQAALQKLASAGANLLGTVLSRVDPRNYRRYGYGALPYMKPG